ncbi:MAG: CHAT domain-containing protein, partial [Saprospiraceae bacterium]
LEALKKSDLYSLEDLVNSISDLTNGFENFHNINNEQKELFLILCSQYYFRVKDPRLNVLLDKFEEIKKEKFNAALRFMTESELNQFLQNDLYSNIDIFFALYCPELAQKSFTKHLFELALYSKGLQFRQSRGINKYLNESQVDSIIDLKNKIRNTDIKLASGDSYKNLLLQRQKEILYREALRLYMATIPEEKFEITTVQRELHKDEIAVEFIKYKSIYGRSDSVKYVAMVLDSENLYPKFVPLFEEDQLVQGQKNNEHFNLDTIEEDKEIRGYGLTPIRSINNNEYTLIWMPILKLFPNVKRIYFSTTGLMNQLNLTSSLIKDSLYMSDKYDMFQLSSTFNLRNIKENRLAHVKSALLIGGVEYGNVEQSSKRKDIASWNFLKGTLREVTNIDSFMLKKSISTTLLTGNLPEEALVKLKLNEPQSIIHFATHGYYDKKNNLNNMPLYFKSNPLTQSVLVLANANGFSNNMNDVPDNGYLNALEISHLDLSQTSLVVLSACETSLGANISQYESNFSLVRGFKIAGAKSIISSLRPISDDATQEFMRLMYIFLLNDKLDVHNAFYQTQKLMKSKNKNPTYWSGFILVD